MMLRLLPIALFCVLVSIAAAKPPQSSLKPPQSALPVNPVVASADGFYATTDGEDVVISGPWTGGRYVYYTTLTRPTAAEVKAALAKAKAEWAAEKAVSQSATGKSQWPLPSAGETVDRDLTEAGPLPDGFTLPDGMKRYKRAAFTQALDRVGSFAREAWRIRALPRSGNLMKWQVSGGMEGVHGFRSDLYKNDVEPIDSMALMPVVNSFGSTQHELGHSRTWPDGARFLDVLSNTQSGKVFELRSREKRDGEWKSRVLFEDEDERPLNFKGLGNLTCASCHDQAGTGGYSSGLVPGGDGVISFPFADLRDANQSTKPQTFR